MSMLYHLGVKGSLEYSESDRMHHGKLLNVRGLWMYEGETEAECQKHFIETVEQQIQHINRYEFKNEISNKT